MLVKTKCISNYWTIGSDRLDYSSCSNDGELVLPSHVFKLKLATGQLDMMD